MASSQPQSAPPREIVVAGSVANLGPGFDALAVAVQLYLRLEVTVGGKAGVLECEFPDSGRPSGENRIERAFRLAEERFGQSGTGLSIEVRSDIPVRAGLGSSAAATIAGLRLYEAVTAPRPMSDWLTLATEIEGHADNAGAALLGGLAMTCQTDGGRVEARSWPWPEAVRVVVGTPSLEVETAASRKKLPEQVALGDAVFNLQRALLLVRSLETGRYEDLREALRDRWHQPARQQFVPGLAEALTLDDPSILGVCLSGSGPSVAVLALEPHVATAGNLLASIYQQLAVPYTIRTLSAHQPFSS